MSKGMGRMAKVDIGRTEGRPVYMDLDVLLRTRLLVQANSGGGKSWLLRRLAEQLFGKVPVWIIDPEGEFATLRERFPFVLVGKGGETPADPRSAQLVAHKLLEHGASAVFDIYELKPQVRQHFVRVLLEALVDAPKALWRHLVVIADEAHSFAPEKGESEAFGAMVDLATRGRKRGFCAVYATQRLAKLSKDATGELLNRLVGPTFEDVDLERAADLLSITKGEKAQFFHDMRVLEPGHFHAVGRAFGAERLQLTVGTVQTTHPELGSSKYAAAPPPAPEKLKPLLPKLQDLPKEAEEKAKTEAQLRAEIRSLKAQLSAKPASTPPPAPAKPTRIEVPILKPADVTRLERAAQKAQQAAKDTIAAAAAVTSALRREAQTTTAAPLKILVAENRISLGKPVRKVLPEPAPEPSGDLLPAQQRILEALAEFAALGRHEVPRTWIAARAKVSHRSGGYRNNLGALRSRGMLEYTGSGGLRLTAEGASAIPAPARPMTTPEMFESCMRLVSPAQGKILKALFEAYPMTVTREDLAAAANVSSTSGGFRNNLGALRSAGMIEYVEGHVKCSPWLFVDEACNV